MSEWTEQKHEDAKDHFGFDDPHAGPILADAVSEIDRLNELLTHVNIELLHARTARQKAEDTLIVVCAKMDELKNEIAPLSCIGGDPLHCHHDGCPYEYCMQECINKVIGVVDTAPEGGWGQKDPLALANHAMKRIEMITRSFRHENCGPSEADGPTSRDTGIF